MENLYYTTLLVLFVVSGLRIIFKEKGGVWLTGPILIIIITGCILFQEQLPGYIGRTVVIGVILIIIWMFRIIKNDASELAK